jgi:hypothetical protein
MLVCPLIILIYLFAVRPFKTILNNARLIIIQMCIIVVIILQIVIYNTTFTVHASYPIGILICMGVIILVSLVAWIRDVIKKICRLRNKDN